MFIKKWKLLITKYNYAINNQLKVDNNLTDILVELISSTE